MSQFEYRMFSDIPEGELLNVLNAEGKKGWDVVTLSKQFIRMSNLSTENEGVTEYQVIFKRETQ